MAYSLGGRSGHYQEPASSSSGTERLSQEDASSLGEIVLSADDFVQDQELKCPITHEKLSPGDRVTKLSCGHMFQPASIKQWVTGRSGTCPVCRARVQGARVPHPPVTTQPVAVVSSSDRIAVHRQNIEALARSILDLQERQMIRLSERRAGHLLQCIQRDVNELRDLGYVPSVALSSILPTQPPLHAPRFSARYGPDVRAALPDEAPASRAPLSLTTFTRRWLEEAGREHQD